MSGEGWRNRLVVEEKKLSDYLLNEDHEQGGPKAKFLIGIGFSPDSPELLRQSLIRQAEDGEAVRMESPFGIKYTVTGDIAAPNGRAYRLQTIWLDEGDGGVRLITVIPRKD